jgi:hypothetical protein
MVKIPYFAAMKTLTNTPRAALRVQTIVLVVTQFSESHVGQFMLRPKILMF